MRSIHHFHLSSNIWSATKLWKDLSQADYGIKCRLDFIIALSVIRGCSPLIINIRLKQATPHFGGLSKALSSLKMNKSFLTRLIKWGQSTNRRLINLFTRDANVLSAIPIWELFSLTDLLLHSWDTLSTQLFLNSMTFRTSHLLTSTGRRSMRIGKRGE